MVERFTGCENLIKEMFLFFLSRVFLLYLSAEQLPPVRANPNATQIIMLLNKWLPKMLQNATKSLRVLWVTWEKRKGVSVGAGMEAEFA